MILCLQLKPPRDDLYLPTNPHYIVKQVIPESATPMQSAAKVPILVAFEVSPPDMCPHLMEALDLVLAWSRLNTAVRHRKSVPNSAVQTACAALFTAWSTLWRQTGMVPLYWQRKATAGLLTMRAHSSVL